jgi:hypothetical protein
MGRCFHGGGKTIFTHVTLKSEVDNICKSVHPILTLMLAVPVK